jgi:hypothetical protein
MSAVATSLPSLKHYSHYTVPVTIFTQKLINAVLDNVVVFVQIPENFLSNSTNKIFKAVWFRTADRNHLTP